MTESIPFWEDWRFWQIAVTGALAFLGFTFGTWIKHAFDLRQDRIRRNHEKVVFAIAFRAELSRLRSDAKSRLVVIGNLEKITTPSFVNVARFDIPAKAVYANNTHRLGELGDRVAELLVGAHGTADHIRHNVAAALADTSKTPLTPIYLAGLRRSFLILTRDAEMAHNALDVFLGNPEGFPILTDVPTDASLDGAPAEPAEPDAAPAP